MNSSSNNMLMCTYNAKKKRGKRIYCFKDLPNADINRHFYCVIVGGFLSKLKFPLREYRLRTYFDINLIPNEITNLSTK